MIINKLNQLCTAFVSKSDIRPALTGVCVRDGKTVATNGSMLFEVDLLSSEDTASFQDVIIPSEFLKKIKIKNQLVTQEGALGEINFIEEGDDIETHSTKYISDEFPKYEQVIPTKEPKMTITVNAEYLERIAKAMKKFAPTGAVKLSLYSDNEAIKFEATSTQQNATALLMPLRQ